MSSIEDRGKDYERKFALDEELRFKSEARRNRLLAQWAADKMGKSQESYIDEVVSADLAEVGSEDVLGKVKSDFDAAGIDIEMDVLRLKLDEFMGVAVEQIESE